MLVHEGEAIPSQIGGSVEDIDDFKTADVRPVLLACSSADPGTRHLVVGKFASSFGDLDRGLAAARSGKWPKLPVANVC